MIYSILLRSISIVCAGAIAALAAEPVSESLLVAKRDARKLNIISTNQTVRPAQYLQHWLSKRGYECTTAHPDSKSDVETVISLNTAPDLMDDTARPDAYSLTADARDGQVRITILGKTEEGVEAGVYRLLQKLANDGKELRIQSSSEQRSPFIRTRLACLAPTGRRQIPPASPLKDADLETWTPERLQAYPELFAQFGFSGIQVMEIRGYGHITGENLERAKRAVTNLMIGAKRLSMFVSLDQWGDCPDVEGTSLCWEVPEEHARLSAFWQDLASRYGKYTDHVYVHVGDPGGATHGGCSLYVTPQKLTAAILKMFREYNPAVQITMSSWANPSFWKHASKPISLTNYDPYFSNANKAVPFDLPTPEGTKFLDETWMPKEVGIALHREYNKDQADLLVASGRPVDVWQWYVSDMEMMTTLTLNMKTVDRHYRDLPDEAGRRIRIQTAELTFHGWPSTLSMYVSAQKMWNPHRPLDEIEREFCTAVCGPDNAEAMLALYKACENPWDYDIWRTPTQAIPKPDDLGTTEGNARMERVLAQVRAMKFPADWQPNFELSVPVQDYIEMLTARLSLTLTYSKAKLAVTTIRKRLRNAGKSQEEIDRAVNDAKKRAIESLPELPIDPLYRQDATTVVRPFKLKSWADLIEAL